MDTPVIDPRTTVGRVHLTVRDLSGMRRFYEELLGFREAWSDCRTVFLSADGLYPFHLGLTADPGAGHPGRSAGLYHAAFLLPTRRALARLLQRLIGRRVGLDGFSDHLVSEAIYLHDPEGNGLELYCDRPRDQWAYDNGRLMMSTEPLDLDGLLAEAGGEGAGSGVDPATRLGHVHLRVSSIGRAEEFYHGILGFDVTVRGYTDALFLSAGGYHHHLGVNVWGSRDAAPAPPGSLGLRYFTVALPAKEELERVVRRAAQRGARIEEAMNHGLCASVTLRDPDGIGVMLTVDRQPGRVSAAGWRSEPRELDGLLRSA
jgi:catechol 2,3-dioxygenase